MTDTEPMYLISESELMELVEDSSEDTYGSYDGVEIGEKVRARGSVAQHDAAIAARAAATERERVLKEKSALIRDVISKDQSGLAEALSKIQTLAKGYDWIPAGEWGSYDYTQRTVETLQKECGYLLAEIERIAYEGLRDSGNRVIAHVRACEESLYSATPAPSVSPEIRNLVDQSFKEYKRDIAPDNRTDSAEQRIVDVIAELERRCDGAGDAGDYVAQSLYSEAISLLKNGVKKDGA